jgi:hypothetical protein
VEAAGAVREKQSVKTDKKLFFFCTFGSCLLVVSFFFLSGRVAAGAIAEKYLRQAYGVEIVAFVSSVGRIHLPYLAKKPSPGSNGVSSTQNDDDTDEDEEQVSEEYLRLLSTVTREQVDENQVRCPDKETADRMVKVKLFSMLVFCLL